MMDSAQCARLKRLAAVAVGVSLLGCGAPAARKGSEPLAGPSSGPSPIASPAASPIAASDDSEPGFRAELSAKQVVDGSLVLLTAQIPEKSDDKSDESKLQARFEDTRLAFYPIQAAAKGMLAFRAVFGVPHNHKPGMLHVEVRFADQKLSLPLEVVDGKYPSETLSVEGRKVTPRKSDMKRINREVHEVGVIYSHLTPTRYWKGAFALPIDSDVTSVYGTKRLYNGQMKNFHSGLDLRAPIGTPIRAPEGGVIAMAKDLFFTGNTVMIDHGYGLITLYAHMSKLEVKVGQVVKRGDLLGLSGMTGRVTGPHLHWAAIIHKTKVNPMDLTRVLK